MALPFLFFLGQAYAQPRKPLATVIQIAAWTTTGAPIEKIWVVATTLDGREKYTGNGRHVELSVPTGEYILQVDAPGFQSKWQILKAYQPRVFRSVALPVAGVHGQKIPSLTGTVQNYGGDVRKLRIRLVSLYGNELRESVPDAQGSFSFPADEGAYLLLVVADTAKGVAIVDFQPMRLQGETTMTINLKGKQGMVLPPAPP